jgi:hypothetical protein
MQPLLDYLQTLAPGPIADGDEVESLLAKCWNVVDPGHSGGMTADKLYGRMEKIVWEPPLLSFLIERHGGTVQGSSRAELQHWSVNVETRTTAFNAGGHRQLRPMRPRLNVKPLAEGVARSILEHREDDQLKWYDDGSVRVLIGNIVVDEWGLAKETLQGRRRRFRNALDQLLAASGWQKVGLHKYAPHQG